MPGTNVKQQEYVNCWSCNHFQRYDRSATPDYCSGECRIVPPTVFLDGIVVAVAGTINFTWPVVLFGDSGEGWCGRYLRSTEQNLPAYPTCQAESLPDLRDNFWLAPWNKKILPGYVDSPEKGICCWNCDHFQPNDPQDGDGFCRAYPPETWLDIDVGARTWYNSYPGPVPGLPVTQAICSWCSEWERARRTVPAPPSGWDLCPSVR